MKHQIYSSIGFLIEAEGVLSVLMQTAYSYADAEQFRNKNAFVIYFFPCIRTEREKLVPNGRASLFNESIVVWCGVYCYRQRYSSSQWSKCCGSRGAADWHCRFYFLPRYRRQIRRFFQCVTIAWHVDASSVVCILMNTANWPFRLWYYCKL